MPSAAVLALLIVAGPFEDLEGVKVSCHQNVQGRSGRARVEVVVAAGALHEGDRERGAAHLLEHLILRPLGFDDSNGATGWDYTSYYRDVRADELGHASAELVRAIARPALTEDDLRVEQQVVLRELEVRGVGRLENLRDPLFEKTVLDRTPGGLSEDVRDLRGADVRRFFDRHYTKQNIAVMLQGALDCTSEKTALRPALREIPSGPRSPVPRVRGREEARRGLPGTRFFSGFYWFDETPEAEVVYRLVAKHLEQEALSELRKKRGLAYSPRGAFERRGRGGRIFIEVRTDNASDEVRRWYERALVELSQALSPRAHLASAARPVGDDLDRDLPRRALAALREEGAPHRLLADVDDAALRNLLPRLLADTRRFDTSATAGNIWSVVILVLVGIAVLGGMYYAARKLA